MIRALSHRKKKMLVLAFCSLVTVMFWGCGKDDKDVSSVTLPASFTYGITDTQYSDAKPRSFTVTPPTTAGSTAATAISWTAPAFTTGLIGYRLYVVSWDNKTSIGLTSKDATTFNDTTSVTSGVSYTYTITSIFSVFDTAYNYYTEIESLPTAPITKDRP